MHIFKCSENYDIHIRCTKLYTHKAMQNSRQYTFIQITGMLRAENIKLNKNYIWNTLEIDWKEVTVTFNENKITLPRVVTIKLQDKIKVRHLMKGELLLFHLMLKQGITWFMLATGTQETA